MQKSTEPYQLLAADEPPPFTEVRRNGRSNFLIVVDHASCLIPRRLGGLGLPASELQRHIAWDIGSLGIARQVAAALDATLVSQNYSRLVIDCNRDPSVASSIPRSSESTEIPGNIGLSAEDVLARRSAIFEPYHDHLRALLDERCRITLSGCQSMIVSDQDHIGCVQSILNLLTIQNRIVVGESLGKLAKIFATTLRILRADFAFHSSQRMQLRHASSGPQISC